MKKNHPKQNGVGKYLSFRALPVVRAPGNGSQIVFSVASAFADRVFMIGLAWIANGSKP
jgi:hypothetical protein